MKLSASLDWVTRCIMSALFYDCSSHRLVFACTGVRYGFISSFDAVHRSTSIAINLDKTFNVYAHISHAR